MRIIVLYNPVSGRGIACKAAGEITQALLQEGNDVELIPTQKGDPHHWLVPKLAAHLDAVVIVGGDGTLRSIASALVSTDVPIYHAPSGTENLFATSMGMSSNPKTVLAWVKQRGTTLLDTATANGEFMLLMASVGFDASIVVDLAKHRGASITHASYVMPFVRQLLRWNPPELSIQVDGKLVVEATHGWAMVANSSAYALGANPVGDAVMTDGKLDLLFLPFKSRWHLLLWLWRLLRGVHTKHTDSVIAKGNRVVVHSADDAPWQLDGDPCQPTKTMTIECIPASLLVLQQTVAVDDNACDCID